MIVAGVGELRRRTYLCTNALKSAARQSIGHGERSMGEIILDRRPSARFPFEAKAILCFAGAVYSAVTRDLSSKGAFLVTDVPAPVSTSVELTLDVHDGLSPIEISGRVVRVTSGSASPRGLAVEFDEVEAEVAQRIVAATRQS